MSIVMIWVHSHSCLLTQVAAYLSSVSSFTGNVIIVTSPEGIKECSTVSARVSHRQTYRAPLHLLRISYMLSAHSTLI